MAACASSVRASKRSWSRGSTANVARMRDSSCVASRECPPRSKKSSSAPVSFVPSSSFHSVASRASVSVRGWTKPSSAPWTSGAGSARRSTLPLRVTGSDARRTMADGTMYPGSRSRSQPRKAVTSSNAGAPVRAGAVVARGTT
ncbi:hypothetical protein COSO111634_31790 [Corallococcus soli]